MLLFFFFTLVTGPRRSLGLKLQCCGFQCSTSVLARDEDAGEVHDQQSQEEARGMVEGRKSEGFTEMCSGTEAGS